MNRRRHRSCIALAALVLTGVSAGAAHADQCAWVSHDTAERARRALAARATVLDYCEPCGDPAPGTPRAVDAVSVSRIDQRYSQVVVDGQGVDLAYLYLRTGPDRFDNLAAIAGCPATGVSPTLAAEPATASGILIRAAEAAPPAAAPTAPTAPPPAAAPPAPRRVHIVHVHAPAPLWPLALVAAGSALAAAALALAALALAHRRRQSALPRALALGERRDRP